MPDYSHFKVPELRKLLQDKSLPISGNKAELIARLKEADKTPAADAPATTGEDEIDWDEDDEKKATTTTTTPADAAIAAAGGKEEIPNPTKVPNQEPAIDPATTTDLKVTGGEGAPTAADGVVAASGPTAAAAEVAPEAVPEAPKPDFSAGLEKTDAEKEAEKRAARAKRFGITEDEEATKLAERAKKFGLDASEKVVKGLDSALPERREKRARDEKHQGGRNPKRQTPDRRSQSGPKNNQKPTQKPQQKPGAKKPSGGRITDDPAEKAKAEARAKRFQSAA
ncbi:SAP domain protein [Rutstroemia sp. NJR-2017a WRK4]|nr:SAP domain protein [Rutstroemia sp. NJR-2017a WRK4]